MCKKRQEPEKPEDVPPRTWLGTGNHRCLLDGLEDGDLVHVGGPENHPNLSGTSYCKRFFLPA